MGSGLRGKENPKKKFNGQRAERKRKNQKKV